MPERDQIPVITASEVAQHAFCARAWWLTRVKGHPSAHTTQLMAGQAAHLAHGRSVLQSQRLQGLAYLLLSLAALVAVAGLCLRMRGG